MILVEIVARAIDAQDDFPVNVKGKDAGISDLFVAVGSSSHLQWAAIRL